MTKRVVITLRNFEETPLRSRSVVFQIVGLFRSIPIPSDQITLAWPSERGNDKYEEGVRERHRGGRSVRGPGIDRGESSDDRGCDRDHAVVWTRGLHAGYHAQREHGEAPHVGR